MANKLQLNLSGGMNTRTSQLIIKDNECELAVNYNLDQIGSLTKRGGMGLFGLQIIHNVNVNGLYQFDDISTNTKIPLMAENNSPATAATLYYFTGGNWAASNRTTDTPSKRTRFSTFVDYTFRVNGADNVITTANGSVWGTTNAPAISSTTLTSGINSGVTTIPVVSTGGFVLVDGRYIIKIDNEYITADSKDGTNFLNAVRGAFGTTAAAHSNGATVIDGQIPLAKYTAVFQDRVYLANGGFINQSRVWFSSLPVNGAVTWDIANDWIDINPDDGDEITGLENNGNRLLMFKHKALYRWTFGQVEPDRLIGTGTDSQESIKTNFDIGITFFANKNGIYAYTSGRPKLISRKVQQFIDAVTDWTTVYAGIDRDHYYLAVGNVTVDRKTYTNLVFVYNIPLDGWTVHQYNCPRITAFATLQASNVDAEFQVVGTADGRTYRVNLTDSYNDINDAGAQLAVLPIPGEFVSKEYLLSFPNRTNVSWIDVWSMKRLEASVFYDLDREDLWGQGDLGAMTERVSNFRVPQRECNSIRLKVSDPGQASGVTSTGVFQSVEGFNIEHEPKEKRDEMPTNNLRRRKNHG